MEYFSAMMAMCMRYIKDKDRASGIVNDGFLKVFKKIDQFEARGSLEGWIRRIVFHTMSDTLKKETNYLKFMVFEEYDRGHENTVLDKLYEGDILKMIEKIPGASADVFVLFAIQGYAHKEIAEKKGISVGTSKWHVAEARKKLQELILKNYTHSTKNAG